MIETRSVVRFAIVALTTVTGSGSAAGLQQHILRCLADDEAANRRAVLRDDHGRGVFRIHDLVGEEDRAEDVATRHGAVAIFVSSGAKSLPIGPEAVALGADVTKHALTVEALGAPPRPASDPAGPPLGNTRLS